MEQVPEPFKNKKDLDDKIRQYFKYKPELTIVINDILKRLDNLEADVAKTDRDTT